MKARQKESVQRASIEFPWDMFQSPETGHSLSPDDTGKWLVTDDGTERWPVIDGIPDFILRTDPDPFGEMIRHGGWPRRHWNNRQKEHQTNRIPSFATGIAAEHGVILEIASGPGGGFMPWIALCNARAQVLAFDICRMLLEDWKALLDESGAGRSVAFAAFDACRMPLRAASVDAASNRAGIGNIAGWKATLAEIVRVLKPGGRIYSQDLVFKAEDLIRLPEEYLAEIEQQYTPVTRGLVPLFTEAGLQVISSVWDAEFLQDPDQSGIAKTAAEFGVPLHAAINEIVAVKAGEI